jgi:hypothetical protein
LRGAPFDVLEGTVAHASVKDSSTNNRTGWIGELSNGAFPKLRAEAFKGSPIETEYKKLSPTPNEFPNFVKRLITSIQWKPHDFGAEKFKATKAPMLFIHGDADGVRLDHIADMFSLKGGELSGDMRRRSESRLAILPNSTHVPPMYFETTKQRNCSVLPISKTGTMWG